MTAGFDGEAARGVIEGAPSHTTPAGLEAISTLTLRRVVVLTLVVGTWALLIVWVGSILATGGWKLLDIVLFLCAALGSPWAVLGFWNAIIGLWQLHVTRTDPQSQTLVAESGRTLPVTVNTAIVMTLRNEDPGRAMKRLRIIKDSLDATPSARKFSFFLLSDTDRPDVVAAEERAVKEWREDDRGGDRIFYRRRDSNEAYKAGNIRDFLLRWGERFELMLPLDADSLMTASAIVRLVGLMQRHPKIGILQSLVVGTPSASPFARIFQFGMRLGMRTYTAGQAWWVGDCGPFWGHNALVRIKPFLAHCDLPKLGGKPPFGGHLFSHDQVEATLMRRAGYEVRVLPVELGSFEDSPPDALEFTSRDVRWCQGNLQYARLLGLAGLERVSRFQLVWAILMFLGVPAWTIMIALLPALAFDAELLPAFSSGSAAALYATFTLMHLTPKIAGLIDAALTPGELNRFGGGLRMAASALIEIVFSFLLGAISGFRVTIFMAGLLVGRSIPWGGQRRDAGRVSLSDAATALWPHMVFGLVVCASLIAVAPGVLVWSLPLTAGYLLAIPFTVLTSDPRIGSRMKEFGIATIPEDIAPPPELRALNLPERCPA